MEWSNHMSRMDRKRLLSSSNAIRIATRASLLKSVSAPSTARRMEVVQLESEPMLELVKKSVPKIGKSTKVSLRNDQAKRAAEDIMQSRDPTYKARYAKTEYYKKLSGQNLPQIEVLEVEGNVLLGIPASSSAQQFATFTQRGHRKQIVIATHDPNHKPARRAPGAARPIETDAAVMRSGVAALSKQLTMLRESIAATRQIHNSFNNIKSWNLQNQS